MTKRLFDLDPYSGSPIWFEGDGAGGFSLTHTADVEPIIEGNKTAYNSGKNGWVSPAKEMKHVAEIPNAIALKWLVEEGIDIHNRNHWQAVKRKLNSSEWLYLRTAPGRI